MKKKKRKSLLSLFLLHNTHKYKQVTNKKEEEKEDIRTNHQNKCKISTFL